MKFESNLGRGENVTIEVLDYVEKVLAIDFADRFLSSQKKD